MEAQILSVDYIAQGKTERLYENPRFVKKTKSQKKKALKAKRRRKRKREEAALAQQQAAQEEQSAAKRRKPNPKSQQQQQPPPHTKKKIQPQPEDEIWEFWAGSNFSSEDRLHNCKTAARAQEVVLGLLENLEKKDEIDGFEKHILKSGTMTDRLSVWTVMFQENPLARLSLLSKLVKWAHRKNHREKQLALQNLVVLFTSEVMPTRGLKKFEQHSFKRKVSEKVLCMWYLEGQLKEAYAQFMTALEEGTKGHMDWFRMKCIEMITSLLQRNAEGEKVLLMLLIHKLGDKANKVSSCTMRHVQKLLKRHSAMKGVVAKEISDYLKRSHQQRGRNYALTLLSEFEYHSTEQDKIAARLVIELFLEVFREVYIQNKTTVTGKMMCAIFSGMRRAFPYAEPDLELFEENLLPFYELTRTSSLQTSVQALLMLRQIEEASGEISTQFYRALYKLLLRPELTHSNKPHLLLHILYVTIKNDKNLVRACAFLKRLCQIMLHHNAAFTCGAVMLVAECFKHHAELEELFVKTELQCMEETLGLVEVSDKPRGDPVYDETKRKPAFANATNSAMWETTLLWRHYHPSAQIWATKLVESKPIYYKGDPLVDFTPTAFLSRYCYRKSKRPPKSSKFAREAKHAADTVIDLYDRAQPSKAINPSDILFHKFFAQRKQLDPDYYKRREEKKKPTKSVDLENEDVDKAMFDVMKNRFGVDMTGNLDDNDWALLEEMNIGMDEDEVEMLDLDEDYLNMGKDDEQVFVDATEFAELLASGAL